MIKEYIVLVEFESVLQALDYMNKTKNYFAFISNGKTYDFNGNEINSPNEYESYLFGEIYIDITDGTFPGGLYMTENFLKYYKEIIE